jgi:hypothetical protein
MTKSDLMQDTWHDILIRNGIDSDGARSLIGFVSWNKGDEFAYLGREITEVLSNYQGKVFARDAVSREYGDKALLFFSKDVSEERADKIFEIIMSWEQKNVYSTNNLVEGR